MAQVIIYPHKEYYLVESLDDKAKEIFPAAEGKQLACYKKALMAIALIKARCLINNLKYQVNNKLK